MSLPNDTRRIPLPSALLGLVTCVLAACNAQTPDIATGREATYAAHPSAPLPAPPQPSIDPPGSRSGAALPGDDGTLAAMVESALLAEPELHQAAIDVSAVDGTVYLRGKAKDRSTRRLATQVAGAVDGVKRVRNELFVAAGS